MKKELNIVWRESLRGTVLTTLDAKVCLLIQRTKNLVHHNFVKVVGCTPPILSSPPTNKTRGASHSLWPCHFTFKKYLKAKEEDLLWKLKYFTMQKYNLSKKNPLKENQNIVQDIIITLL
jgi:hypothetical protein